jgi:hypothetical protein
MYILRTGQGAIPMTVRPKRETVIGGKKHKKSHPVSISISLFRTMLKIS